MAEAARVGGTRWKAAGIGSQTVLRRQADRPPAAGPVPLLPVVHARPAGHPRRPFIPAVLPADSNALPFAQRYRVPEGEASAPIVISTFGFALTAPLWLLVPEWARQGKSGNSFVSSRGEHQRGEPLPALRQGDVTIPAANLAGEFARQTACPTRTSPESGKARVRILYRSPPAGRSLGNSSTVDSACNAAASSRLPSLSVISTSPSDILPLNTSKPEAQCTTMRPGYCTFICQ